LNWGLDRKDCLEGQPAFVGTHNRTFEAFVAESSSRSFDVCFDSSVGT
jgi:hypothetical protein